MAIHPAFLATSLLAASIISVPAAADDGTSGSAEVWVQVGSTEIHAEVRLERLTPFTEVMTTQVVAGGTPTRIGEVAFVTVELESPGGGTFVTLAAFGFQDACETYDQMPLVRDCQKVPGTAQAVTAPDPELETEEDFFCLYHQKFTVNVGPFQPFFSTGETKEPVHGRCP